MSLDWDILLDDVSIKDKIEQFEVRVAKGGYAKELTIDFADVSFYESLEFTVLPSLCLEAKIKEGEIWTSLGNFYLEEPAISSDTKKNTSRGIWGRSESAKAGSPFAAKVSKSWESTTTAGAIMNEMAALVDLTVTLEINDYTVFANSYMVENVYPIDVIIELAEFAGAVVCCTSDGNLAIKPNLFHPSSADHTITDSDIISIDEDIEYPEFGNRIKISADGSDSGIVVNLESATDSDCLPANGSSRKTLYAFVSDDNGAVNDGVVVSWSAEDGVSLDKETSQTQSVLISNKIHNADNYYKVTVDYPISDVIGIWAYSDRKHENNFWNSLGSFEDNEITVYKPFKYCDQTLIITYITSGCAINTVTAGSIAQDVIVTADVNGVQDTIEIKLGNTCACGSSLNAIKNTDTDICFGSSAPILIWAEINGGPATGMIAALTLTGCGELSSTKKILSTVKVINEIGYVVNEISGTSQVECSVFPNNSVIPKVYLTTDSSKSNNLYSSRVGKLIDLDTEIDTGTEVWIDYTAEGAAAVSWMTDGISEECDAEILIKIADGSEAGLSETVSLSTTDCSIDESDSLTSDYYSDDDPDTFNNDGVDGGTSDVQATNACIKACEDDAACITNCFHAGGAVLTSCDIIVLERIANLENATDETKNDIRFGISSQTDCAADDPFGCPCSELCESEIYEHGNTYDYNKTIHETVIETYTDGSAEYYEEYASLRAENLSECEENCEAARAIACEECPGGNIEIDKDSSIETIGQSSSGSIIFTGGEAPITVEISGTGFWLDSEHTLTSVEITGNLFTIYTDEAACGSGSFTISDGCSSDSHAVRCTVGQWVYYNDEATLCNLSESSPYISGEYKQEQSAAWVLTCAAGTGLTTIEQYCDDCYARIVALGYEEPDNCLDLGEITLCGHCYECTQDWIATTGAWSNNCYRLVVTFATYKWEC